MRLPPLVAGRLLRRYKRFLADVELDTGAVVTAHSANTGSMRGCAEPGARVWLSAADNPKRKLAWTWELVEAAPGVVVGIHTGRANGLVEEAIGAGRLHALGGAERVRREVRYGSASRIDLLFEYASGPPCHVEVKNVTLAEAGVARFPDAVTTRGTKHLHEMAAVVGAGGRAAMVYCVPRGDVGCVCPADDIDPVYGAALRAAMAAGVEAYALTGAPDPAAGLVRLEREIPVLI
ncbi:DNA/RNA nuclease SfsA [Nitrogeniibacter mangrovi]|uniref:Sugar fermentation stimulation protein homolog n=1 Tax=Nitrogeniibacter mangrovi TaxID=2016596 RepID=A0A6C1B3H2_9RHOO|nr:DNA/RNA nuclease SfsA [Nitrogeniibacter mangrovi]QID16754.1 DNA/RNA nuclease SfsA [Nitrogeniibacter mangrovi]